MQIEVYRMEAAEDALTITLEAVCDTFSSLLWDIEYYKCGSFEVYIAANPQNIEIFQTGRNGFFRRPGGKFIRFHYLMDPFPTIFSSLTSPSFFSRILLITMP